MARGHVPVYTEHIDRGVTAACTRARVRREKTQAKEETQLEKQEQRAARALGTRAPRLPDAKGTVEAHTWPLWPKHRARAPWSGRKFLVMFDRHFLQEPHLVPVR